MFVQAFLIIRFKMCCDVKYLNRRETNLILLFPTDQMDEGLAGRQRQYEGLIHSLSKELNLCKAANHELNSKIRDIYGLGDQNKSEPFLKIP